MWHKKPHQRKNRPMKLISRQQIKTNERQRIQL